MASFHQVSSPKPCSTSTLSIRATSPAHLIRLDLIIRIIFGVEYRSFNYSWCCLLQSPVTSTLSLLDQNILHSTLFSYGLSLRPSLNVGDQVSHPYNITFYIIVLYILIFMFSDSKLEDKRFCTEWQTSFPDFNLLFVSSRIKFGFIKFVPKYLTDPTLQSNYLSIFILWLRSFSKRIHKANSTHFYRQHTRSKI